MVDWRSFLLGASLAALAAILQAATVLPSPWGALASAALVLVTTFLRSPLSPSKKEEKP